MRLVLAALLAIGVAMVPAQRAMACSCAMATLIEAAGWADAVFAGRVVAEVALDVRDPGGVIAPEMMTGQTIYTFAVDGVAKGPVADRIDVRAGGDGASCGMTFGRDQRWLVFTMLENGIHQTGLCSGNLVLEPGVAVPLELTTPESTGDPAGDQVPVPLVLVLGTIAAITGASWLAFRRGRVS